MSLNPKILVIGDVHAEASDLDDCRRLTDLVVKTVEEQQPHLTLYMGDQYDRHDTVSVRVMEYWDETFCKIPGTKAALLGNHDKSSPHRQWPHAMIAHSKVVGVIDKPTEVYNGVVLFPHFQEQKDFLEAQAANPGKHLYCHQTFEGAKYENGFPATDAVSIDELQYSTVASGHIHSAQAITGKSTKVVYVGSPRYRVDLDAKMADRWIWMFTHAEDGSLKGAQKFSTAGYCRKLLRLEDRPETPVEVGMLGEHDILRVDVYGPTAEYVRSRETELRAKYGARTRGFPDRAALPTRVRESEGMAQAMARFAKSFQPPHQTPLDVMNREISNRLGDSWAA